MKRVLYLLIMIVTILSACSEGEIKAPPHFGRPKVPDPYKMLYSPGLTEEQIVGFWAKLPYDNITLQRTGCYGSCPVYTVTLHRGGKAEFNAEKYLPKLGNFAGEVDPYYYGRLCYLIDQSGFMDMDNNYHANWTDSATCIVTATASSGSKMVSDYGGVGPIELWAIQELMDAAKERIEWKPIP